MLTFVSLLAYGVFQVKSRLWGWQILFLIEGTITIAFAALVFWLLPFAPSSARFLSDREKVVAMLRILKDGSSETETKLDRRAFLAPLKDWKYYVFTIICELGRKPLVMRSTSDRAQLSSTESQHRSRQISSLK